MKFNHNKIKSNVFDFLNETRQNKLIKLGIKNKTNETNKKPRAKTIKITANEIIKRANDIIMNNEPLTNDDIKVLKRFNKYAKGQKPTIKEYIYLAGRIQRIQNISPTLLDRPITPRTLSIYEAGKTVRKIRGMMGPNKFNKFLKENGIDEYYITNNFNNNTGQIIMPNGSVYERLWDYLKGDHFTKIS